MSAVDVVMLLFDAAFSAVITYNFERESFEQYTKASTFPM
jgi:hypothetical protein